MGERHRHDHMNDSSPLICWITPKAWIESVSEPRTRESSSAPAICVSVTRRKPPPLTTLASISTPIPVGIAKRGRCRSKTPRLPVPSVVRRSGCSIPNPSMVTVRGPRDTTIVPLALIGKSDPESATLVERLWITMPAVRHRARRTEADAAVEMEAVGIETEQQLPAQDDAAARQEESQEISRGRLGDRDVEGRHAEPRPP